MTALLYVMSCTVYTCIAIAWGVSDNVCGEKSTLYLILHNTCPCVCACVFTLILCGMVTLLFLQEGEEFLAREAKRTKTDEDAAEGEKEAEVSAEA